MTTKQRLGLALLTALAALGAARPSAAATDNGAGAGDAGSLGLVAEGAADTWCLADARSLGLPDPVAACR